MKKIAIAAAALVFLLAGGSYLLFARTPISQPIAFNHFHHVKEVGLDCSTCHLYYETERFSGLPTLETCMGCHEEPVTQKPEEEKIRQFAKAGKSLEWNRLYNVPEHVYYSHQRHVAIAKIDCAVCHGKIAETQKPPSAPLNKLTMSFCIDCHEKNHASTDCIACHK